MHSNSSLENQPQLTGDVKSFTLSYCPPVLSETQGQQLLMGWNNTVTDYRRDRCIQGWFEEQAQQTPDAIAVMFGHEQLTYQQLNQQANQLAHHLQALGVEPEILVGICIERSLLMVVALLAVLKAGGLMYL